MRRNSSRVGLIGVLLLLGVRVAGGQRAPAPPTPRDTTPASVVRAYVQAYNAHDLDAMLSFFAPDFVWLNVTGDSVTVEARGVAAIRTQMVEYFRRLPSARSELDQLTVLGSWVSAKERALWTAASGPRSQASLSVYEVRGGLLRRVWYYPVVR